MMHKQTKAEYSNGSGGSGSSITKLVEVVVSLNLFLTFYMINVRYATPYSMIFEIDSIY